MTETAIRTAILDAAERVLVERGFDGMSLEAVAAEAGVAATATGEELGSRAELLRAVLDRIMLPLVDLRLEMLDRAIAANDGAPVPVEQILEAFVKPDLVVVAQLRARDIRLAQFVGRTYGDQTPFVRAIAAEQFSASGERFFAELTRTLPQVPVEELAWRMYTGVVGILVAFFLEQPAPDRDEDAWVETTLERLVSFAAPGLAS